MTKRERLIKDFKEQFKGFDYFDIFILASLFFTLVGLATWLILTKVSSTGEMGHWPLTTLEVVISLIGTYLTMVYILLVSKGKKIGFTYGILAQIFWGINAIFGVVWFQIILRFGIFLPLTIYGTWMWFNQDSHELIPEGKKILTIFQLVSLLVFIFALAGLGTYLMSFIDVMGKVYKDGVAMHDYAILYMDIALMLLGTTATYLTIKDYSSAWYVWVITNILGVVFYGYFTFMYGNWLLLLGMIGWAFYGINSLRAFYSHVYLYEIKGKKHKSFRQLR